MNNALFQFIAEFSVRMFSKKPKFFAIIQWISVTIGSVGALLAYLHSANIPLPEWTAKISEVNIIVGSIVAMIMSQLPNSDPKEVK